MISHAYLAKHTQRKTSRHCSRTLRYVLFSRLLAVGSYMTVAGWYCFEKASLPDVLRNLGRNVFSIVIE